MRTIPVCEPDGRFVRAGVSRESKTRALRHRSRGALLVVSAGRSKRDECEYKRDADAVGETCAARSRG
jgi:hypothetical protein